MNHRLRAVHRPKQVDLRAAIGAERRRTIRVDRQRCPTVFTFQIDRICHGQDSFICSLSIN
nr:MAG TPA: hypothetical protein [Caudoviricetes sp.]